MSENKTNFIDTLMEKVTAMAEWLSSKVFLEVLKKSMTVSIPVTLVGSIYLVILCFPVLSDHYPGWFMSFFTQVFGPLYSVTIPLISLYILLSIAYNYSEVKNTNKLLTMITALGCFLVVTPFAEDGNISTQWLGSTGMFVAILVGFLSTYVFSLMSKTNFKIKLPESVPAMVSQPFEAIVPAAVTYTVFCLIGYIFAHTSFGNIHQCIYTLLQKPLTGLTTSLPATIIVIIVSYLLWFAGLHGASIVGAVVNPMWNAALLANLDAIQKGQAPQYIMTDAFYTFFVNSVMPGIIAMLIFARSKQLRTVAKISFVPNLFNIGEPFIFGTIVGNAKLIIPFVLAPIIRCVVSWICMAIGLCPLTNGQYIPWTMPLGISGFLATGSIMGTVVQLLAIAAAALIWIPFIHVYDAELLKEEKGE